MRNPLRSQLLLASLLLVLLGLSGPRPPASSSSPSLCVASRDLAPNSPRYAWHNRLLMVRTTEAKALSCAEYYARLEAAVQVLEQECAAIGELCGVLFTPSFVWVCWYDDPCSYDTL